MVQRRNQQEQQPHQRDRMEKLPWWKWLRSVPLLLLIIPMQPRQTVPMGWQHFSKVRDACPRIRAGPRQPPLRTAPNCSIPLSPPLRPVSLALQTRLLQVLALLLLRDRPPSDADARAALAAATMSWCRPVRPPLTGRRARKELPLRRATLPATPSRPQRPPPTRRRPRPP